MRRILIILMLPTFFACKKDALNINDYWICNQSQNLDSAAIVNKLIGSWVWTKQSSEAYKKPKQADKIVKVTFNANGNFTVAENSGIVAQGTWKLEIVDGNMYGLDVSQQSQYLHGRILFCSNELLFNDSYRDGYDNLFVKSN